MGDTLVCQMEGVLTPIERTLVARGKGIEVRALRRSFYEVMEAEFIGTVEKITACAVRAFLAQLQLTPEVAIVVFVTEPQPNLYPGSYVVPT